LSERIKENNIQFLRVLILYSFCLMLNIVLMFQWVWAYSGNEGRIKFFENKGQWKEEVSFRADVPDGALFLGKNSMRYVLYDGSQMQKIHKYFYNHPPGSEPAEAVSPLLKHHAYEMKLLEANENAQVIRDKPSQDYRNYYIGNDARTWASSVYAWSSLLHQDVYPGIDWKVYGHTRGIKYDFIVHPGGDPDQIKIAFSGAESVELIDGAIKITTSVHTLFEAAPIAWQWIKGNKKEVVCRYILKDTLIMLDFPKGYNSKYDLVIDPTVVFSTFSGSTSDNWGFTATYDSSGNLYSGGTVYGPGFPVSLGAYQVNFIGGPAPTGPMPVDNCDMAILKYSSNGNNLMYATYLGGYGGDYPHSLFVNENNELLIMGTTGASNFPVTPGAYDVTHNGGYDIVIVKMNAAGTSLIASTFVGGSGHDGINNTAPFSLPTAHPLHYQYADDFRGEIQADIAGNIYVITSTQSQNFPVTPGAFQTTHAGGLLDVCAFKMNPGLSAMVWSTFIGGTAEDAGYSMALVPDGSVYVAGGTNSANFPKGPSGWLNTYQGGRSDGFVVHLNTVGNAIISGTFLGTADYDQAYFVQRDFDGNIFVCGQTSGGTYPIANTLYSIPGGGQFVTRLSANLNTMAWSSTFGQPNNIPSVSPTAFLVDQCGFIYFAGWGGSLSNSTTFNLPVTPDAFQSITDGNDFYLTVFQRNMSGLHYATFIGGNQSSDHVDGGTSRFDKRGIVYHAVCGGCGGFSDFPVTPGVWSTTNNSTNCNNAAFKIDFGLAVFPPEIIRPVSSGLIGDTLFFYSGVETCYDFLITDADVGDSLTFYPGGDLFGMGSMPPPYATTTNDSGLAPLTVRICWTPSCEQADTYWQLPIRVTDNTACPLPLSSTDMLYAKINPDPISPPDIRCVSVTGPDQISLTWINPPPVTGFFAYYIFRRESGTNWVLIDSVMNAGTNTFIDNTAWDAYTRRYAYRLSTVRECSGKFQSDPGTEAVSSLCTANEISAIESDIRWNHYRVWDNPLYTLEVDTDNDFDLLQDVPDTSTFYLNCAFQGRFRSVTTDPLVGCTVYSGYSKVVVHQDSLPSPPVACRVTVIEGDKGVRLEWNPDVSPNLYGYKIFRKTLGQEDAFTELDELPSNLVRSYEDFKTHVDAHRYCYVVAATDRCGNYVVGTDTSCTILLKAEAHEYASEINWSEYTGWKQTLENYEVWMAPESYKFYKRISTGDSTFFEYIDRDIFKPQPGFCYRVKALRSGNQCGTESWSNEDCVVFVPLLHSPNAFSPNGDGINDYFIISHYFVHNYHLVIFDRWGNHIYESFDKHTHWDGTNNGLACQEGVYIYVVVGTGYNGESITQKGTVTLVR